MQKDTLPNDHIQKLEQRIFGKVGKAIHDFDMIHDGDKIMVAISGGKDSWVLLHVLWELKKRAPVDFEIVALNIDQGYAGFRQDVVEDYCTSRGIPYQMEFRDIATPVLEKSEEGAIPCSLCSRLRRGTLYGMAEKLGCNKIALGHHQDDMIETLLLNAFFIGKLAAMAPKLNSDDGKNIVIRPLAYVKESDIVNYSQHLNVPIVCCQCPLMCGADVHADHKRQKIKALIGDLEKDIPDIRNSMLAALTNIKPSHLLDKNLWDFSQRGN